MHKTKSKFKKYIKYLRVRSVPFSVYRCQIFALFNINIHSFSICVVQISKLYFSPYIHCTVPSNNNKICSYNIEFLNPFKGTYFWDYKCMTNRLFFTLFLLPPKETGKKKIQFSSLFLQSQKIVTLLLLFQKILSLQAT